MDDEYGKWSEAIERERERERGQGKKTTNKKWWWSVCVCFQGKHNNNRWEKK